MTLVPERCGKDIGGRPYARLHEIKAGDIIELDDGFTCIPAGQHKVVTNDVGELCVLCAADHENVAEQQGEEFDKNSKALTFTQFHKLSGNLEDHGHGRIVYLGIYLVP